MKALLALLVFILCAGSGLYYFYNHVQQEQTLQQERAQQLIQQQKQIVIEQKKQLGHVRETIPEVKTEAPRVQPIRNETSSYKCDGREYCSQMRSLEEANWFIRHCPNTKMDGDHDGEPCENDSRWH